MNYELTVEGREHAGEDESGILDSLLESPDSAENIARTLNQPITAVNRALSTFITMGYVNRAVTPVEPLEPPVRPLIIKPLARPPAKTPTEEGWGPEGPPLGEMSSEEMDKYFPIG